MTIEYSWCPPCERKRRVDGEETIYFGLSADDEIRRDMIEVVDRLNFTEGGNERSF